MVRYYLATYLLVVHPAIAESALDAGAKGAVTGAAMMVIAAVIGLLFGLIRRAFSSAKRMLPSAKTMAEAGVAAAKDSLHSFSGKKCPHCAERIRLEAIVCRYCGRDVPASPDPSEGRLAVASTDDRSTDAAAVLLSKTNLSITPHSAIDGTQNQNIPPPELGPGPIQTAIAWILYAAGIVLMLYQVAMWVMK